MNGQYHLSKKSPPPLPRPWSPRAVAVTGRGTAGSRSKQAPERRPGPSDRGVLSPYPGERREPQPVQDPAPAGHQAVSARAREGEMRTFSRPPSPGPAGRDASPKGSLPRLYLLFHVPQQFLFDCVLRAAHGAAGGGEATPSCPPKPPARPRRLRASPLSAPRARRSPRLQRSEPAAAAAATARCWAPQPSSNPAQTSGGWPGPFPQPGAGGALCNQEWGGVGAGGGGRARLGVAGPRARASRAAVMATRWRPPRRCELAL